MCDTFRPLHPTKEALALDDPAYPASWENCEAPGAGGNGRVTSHEETPTTW